MDQEKLSKPKQLSDKTWRQHLQWMSVGGEQVEENFARHLSRMKEDASRCRELWERHQAVLNAQPRTKSLFCD